MGIFFVIFILLININTISNRNKYSFLRKFSQSPEPNEKVKKIEKPNSQSFQLP
ncbi:hypothetical protein CAPGI0001_2020 [Capnocytophaga gingivalis ATCC 33624]|nr:hypothetical protein CAPGI0001_2020 [Capnocytophaga gingivalis ATCC 33624]